MNAKKDTAKLIRSVLVMKTVLIERRLTEEDAEVEPGSIIIRLRSCWFCLKIADGQTTMHIRMERNIYIS
jgi:hypothetical protein